MMTLNELGKIYLNSVSDIQKQIEQKHHKMKLAKKAVDNRRVLELQAEIRILENMKTECLEIGHHLTSYYIKGGAKCRKKL